MTLTMAEMRIPTDRIPADILQRLQLIGQSMLVPIRRGSDPSMMSSAPQAASSSDTSSTISTLIDGPRSTHDHQPMLSMTLCSTSSSSSSAPSLLSSQTAAPTTLVRTATSSCSSSSSSSSSSRTTAASPASGDEVDGCPNDSSIVHAISQTSVKKTRIPEVLDNSDIVQIFSLEEDEKHEDRSRPKQTESEIVRIFPEKTTTETVSRPSSIVNIFPSPNKRNISPSPECVHVFDNVRQSSAVSATARNIPASSENAYTPSVVSTTPPTQIQDRHIFAPSPMKFSSVQINPTDTGEFPSTSSYHEIVAHRRISPQPSVRDLSPRPRDSIYSPSRGDAEKQIGKHRQFPPISVNARRSPELPTPPQTPDDADVEDDEVFTYDNSCPDDVVSKRRAVDTFRQTIESTPRRDHAHLHPGSDRSSELRHQGSCRSSPFSPAQKMSELSFGDRQHTRKRLSFDDDNVIQPRPFYAGESRSSSPSSLHSPHCVSANSKVASQNLTNQKCRPPQLFQTRPSTCSPSPFRPPTSDSSPQKFSLPQTPVNQAQAPPPSPYQPFSCPSPVSDVITMLEKVSRQQMPGPSRSRLHSDGDQILGGQRSFSHEHSLGYAGQAMPRRQTISYGKRRRLETTEPARDFDTQSANQTDVVESRDSPHHSDGLCPCAKIERNLLQMAECAYKRIRRMDGSQEDFERFRQELAQTNEILRASLDLVPKIKNMCQNRGNSPSSSPSSSQLASPSSIVPTTSSSR